METSSKFTGDIVTPTKEKAIRTNRLKLNENLKCFENFDPNISSPALELCHSPSIIKSGSSAKNFGSRRTDLNQAVSPSPRKKIRERKFAVAKRKLRKEEVNSSAAVVACGVKCEKATAKSKCLCVAYDSLRASHDEFFRNRDGIGNEVGFDSVRECGDGFENEGIRVNTSGDNTGIGDEGEKERDDALCQSNVENDELYLKRSRDRLMEEARESVPESGSGRVMHLVKAFEKLRMLPKFSDSEEKEAEEGGDDKKVMKWALPGLQQPPKFLTSETLGLNSNPWHSFDSSQGSFGISSRTSAGGKKSRRSSTESSGNFIRRQRKQNQQKATFQKPFMLTTEQRGRHKEEELLKKLQKELEEEEKLRMRIAQGLPRTTDEPEVLVKPPVKESTKPVNLILHSDTRAMERAEFDHQVSKKMNLVEQYRMELERQQRLAEEEEMKRLRKELVPKAQPMPYFDRPFIPRRSLKHPTVPKEPKLRLPQHKKIKSYISIDELVG